LADAHAQGTIGPNLDDAFSSDKAQQFKEQTMADIVRGQIAYPEAPMPANLVRGADANSVALYVAKCAGNANCGITAAKPAAPTPAPAPGPKPSGGTPATAGGKQIFTANCASCHTLKDARATAPAGPNLDQLKPSKEVVAKQVTTGGATMPSFKSNLTSDQIQAVATYVSTVAGK